MNLGISGRTAIVCGASKGLGYACAEAQIRIEAAAAAIRQCCSVTVRPVAADVTTPQGRARIFEQCPRPDILVNNAAGPPPGDFRD